MTAKKGMRPLEAVPRYLLNKDEAAKSLGMKPDHFHRHVQPNLKSVRVGQLVFFSPAELERWSREAVRFGSAGSIRTPAR